MTRVASQSSLYFYKMVGIAQLVRASDCGPEGRRFNSDFPPHNSSGLRRELRYASVVQRLVYKFSKLGTRVRFSPLAPQHRDLIDKNILCSYFAFLYVFI